MIVELIGISLVMFVLDFMVPADPARLYAFVDPRVRYS